MALRPQPPGPRRPERAPLGVPSSSAGLAHPAEATSPRLVGNQSRAFQGLQGGRASGTPGGQVTREGPLPGLTQHHSAALLWEVSSHPGRTKSAEQERP